ncbi:MAG: MarR family winged helix-turn-helix transcriptional regulator [Herbinix sp.]|nr:MarR family winged helix-turn-helix transcriptional regulator [Herbinix sp.]
MLEREFERLYYKFRANYCKNLFASVKEGSLSATDSYCLEVIFLLDKPTVNEFAEYVNISLPNASYRISNLITKGYVKKSVSEYDRREYHLEVTDKFLNKYGANASFNTKLMTKIREDFNKEEIDVLERMIKRIVDEIME